MQSDVEGSRPSRLLSSRCLHRAAPALRCSKCCTLPTTRGSCTSSTWQMTFSSRASAHAQRGQAPIRVRMRAMQLPRLFVLCPAGAPLGTPRIAPARAGNPCLPLALILGRLCCALRLCRWHCGCLQAAPGAHVAPGVFDWRSGSRGQARRLCSPCADVAA